MTKKGSPMPTGGKGTKKGDALPDVKESTLEKIQTDKTKGK